MIIHESMGWIAGDDWEIQATLLDEHGMPYDLGGSEIKWTLQDAAGEHVLDTDDVTITVIDPVRGKCSIVVSAVKTTAILPGTYSDVIRIVSDGVTSTLSYGWIHVSSDPWKLATIQEKVL